MKKMRSWLIATQPKPDASARRGPPPTVSIRISEEAWRHVQKCIGFRARGQGRFIESLIAADAARRDERILAERQREREELTTRESWRATGLNLD